MRRPLPDVYLLLRAHCHPSRAGALRCRAMAALCSRIIPILFVGDLQAERNFYVSLGFHVTYEGPEYPYFLALGHGKVEFGIEWRQDFSSAGPDKVLTWQFGVSDLELAKKRLAE